MRRQLGVRWLCLAIVGLVPGLASCSKPTNSAQSATPAPAASAAPAAAPATGAPGPPAAGPSAASAPIASAQFSQDPNLRADLLEAKRVSGGALLVRWRLVDTAGQPSAGLVAAATPKPARYTNWGWDELYFTDPAENKKYSPLTDTEGTRLLDVYSGDFNAGDQHENWAKFPAPPPTSTKVTIYIPKFPPFEDVPVS